MRINAAKTTRVLAGRPIGVFFGFSAFFVVLFAVFSVGELVEKRRESDDVGLRSRETVASPLCWSEKARRDAAFAPFNAAPTQKAATRLLFEYFLDVETAAEKRDFAVETREFYRTSLTDARNRFQTDAESFERRRRDADDAESARDAVEILQNWNDVSNAENAPEICAATSFLDEFSDAFATSVDVSRAVAQPFASLSELEKSADFRDSTEWLNAENLAPAPVSFESAARDAAPKALGAWGVLSWFCVLPGTFFGRLFGAEAAFFGLFSFKLRRRIGERSRVSSVVSFVFLIETLAATRTLAALSSVRLLR